MDSTSSSHPLPGGGFTILKWCPRRDQGPYGGRELGEPAGGLREGALPRAGDLWWRKTHLWRSDSSNHGFSSKVCPLKFSKMKATVDSVTVALSEVVSLSTNRSHRGQTSEDQLVQGENN